jgi:hypothetical protein
MLLRLSQSCRVHASTRLHPSSVQLVRLLDGLAARQGLDVGPLMVAFQVGAVWRTCVTCVSCLFDSCVLKKKRGCALYGLHTVVGGRLHCDLKGTRCASKQGHVSLVALMRCSW